MTDLNILIQAKLDQVKSAEQINKQLTSLEKKLSKANITVNIDKEKAIININKQLASLENKLKANISFGIDKVKAVENINKALISIEKKLKSLTLQVKVDKDVVNKMNEVNKGATQTTNTMQQQGATVKDLIGEYGELGDKLKETTRLNKELQQVSQTSVYQPKQDERVSVTTGKNGNISSVSITNTQKQLGTLIGTYQNLMTAELQEKDLSNALSKAYEGREIRGVKLNEVTGKWSALLSENATQNRSLSGVIDKTTGSLYRQETQLVQVKNVNMGFMEQIKVAMARIPTWFISMTLYVQAIRQITGSIKYLNELDSKLNEIAIVTNKSQTEVSKLAKEYHNLAYAMSTTTQGIAEASVTFYRQGLQTQDVMSRVRTSIEYAKISGLGFAEASEILTSSINSLGVPAERVSDVFSYLGDAAATGADEVGKALQKVGGTARATGVDFERVAAQAATISSVTRESAESIGDSLKGIYSRMGNLTQTGWDAEDALGINDVAKSLKDALDINLMDQATGQFRNFGDVLDEVGARWATLDQNSKMYLGTTLAGQRQQSRFFNLMENYGTYLKLYDGALNAAGTTQQKYNIYLQSTEAHLNRLSTAGTGVWQKLLDSETIRNGIDLLAGLVNGFSSLVDTFGALPPLITVVTIAFSMFNKTALTSLGVGLTNALGGIMMLIPGMQTLGLNFATLTAKIIASKGALAVFAAEFMLPLAAITLVSIGIQKLTSAYMKNKQAQDELKQQNEQAVTSWSDHGNQITHLLGKYSELSSRSSMTAEQAKEYQQVQNDLNKLMPNLTDNIDDQGNAHLRSAEAIREEIQYVKDLKRNQDELFVAGFDKKIKDQRDAIKTLNKEIQNLSQPKIYTIEDGTGKVTIEETFEERMKRQGLLLAKQKELGNSTKEVEQAFIDLAQAEIRLQTTSDQLTDADNQYIRTLAKEYGQSLSNKDVMDSFVGSITDAITERDILNGTIEDHTKNLGLEETALRQRLGLLSDEINLTKELTNEQINLARTRYFENLVKSLPPGGYVGGNYLMQFESQIARIQELTTSRITPKVTTAPERPPAGGGDKTPFSETLDLWGTKLDELNNKLDEAKQKLQDAVSIEDKTAAYDKMIEAYNAKSKMLYELYMYYNNQEYAVGQQLQQKVSPDSYNKIVSGDISSLTFQDKDTAELAKQYLDLRKFHTQYKKEYEDIGRDIVKEQKSYQDDITKINEDNYSTWLKTVTDIADQVVEAYKDMYKQELDIEEERHKKAIDNLDTELDKYEEVVNAKLKLLDRQDDTESYDKQLSKAQAERNATASQITVLSRDNSMETQAKVAELKKKLAEQDEAIEETKAKRSKDLQKQSLQDGLDNYKKDVQAKKTTETTKYEAEKKRINALIADEQNWSKIRQGILSGDQKVIQQVTKDLQTGITTFTTAMGNSLDTLVNVNMQNAINKLTEVKNAITTIPTITPPTPIKSLRDYVGNRDTVDWDSSSGNVKIGNKTLSPDQLLKAGLTFDNGTWKGAIDKLKTLLGFETGGYTGAFDGGKLGILHQKELILNRGDTSNILAAVNMVRNLMPKLNQPSLAGGPTIGKLEMNFNGFGGSKKDADDVFSKTVGGLRKLGVNI